MRIGVIADTHAPEFAGSIPEPALRALRGVDVILHAGDVGGAGGQATLDRLRAIAPVHAVRGDHDAGLPELPERMELELGGRRIGLIHGNRSRLLEEPFTFLGTITLGLLWPDLGLAGWLRRQFPDADLVVYGHTHRARAERRGGTLLFNPGAVYLVDASEARRRLGRRPGWFTWGWLQVIRHRRDRMVPSVGVLELDAEGVRAHVIPLPQA